MGFALYHRILKKKENWESKPHPIYIKYSFGKDKYYWPVKESVPLKDIDLTNHGKWVKSHYRGFSTINKNIKKKWDEFDTLIESLGGTPNIPEVRQAIEKSKEKVEAYSFIHHFKRSITHREEYGMLPLDHKTITQYNIVLGILKNLDPGGRLKPEDITRLWIRERFIPHIQHLKPGTQNKRLGNLKTVLSALLESDIIEEMPTFPKRKKSIKEDPYVISKEQAFRLLNLPLGKAHSNARDLFLILFWTGQRVGDLSQLIEPQEGDQFKVIQAKRSSDGKQQTSFIPVTPALRELWNRNPYQIADQKLNAYLKEIAIKFNESFSHDPIDSDKLTSHTGRRSFATMLFDEGESTSDIMAITGHASESSFLLYINRKVEKDVSSTGQTLARLQMNVS